MKPFAYIITILLILSSCATQAPIKSATDTLSFEKNEEEEYDIIVLDTEYNMYLMSIAKPMNFYSEEYYKNKNIFYVSEWNSRVSQPFRFDPNFYSMRIDYNPTENYGLKLEYKLYNYFQFINWKYKVNLDFGR
ncbi:DUF6146 family protein [Moheibacter stercoris]|uniref:Lipoprotein n=1 Tax=Moheibacter stercoris TaxID=1628251 RepID=A0ABV2LRE3_9FLAO